MPNATKGMRDACLPWTLFFSFEGMVMQWLLMLVDEMLGSSDGGVTSLGLNGLIGGVRQALLCVTGALKTH